MLADGRSVFETCNTPRLQYDHNFILTTKWLFYSRTMNCTIQDPIYYIYIIYYKLTGVVYLVPSSTTVKVFLPWHEGSTYFLFTRVSWNIEQLSNYSQLDRLKPETEKW